MNGRPSCCGGVLATRQTVSRTGGPNLAGRPPLHFGSNAANPCSLNAWITSRAYCGFIANIAAASDALRPWADASTIPARRSRTRSFVVRVIFTRRCASSGSSERTNTSGCRAITTSASKPPDSPPHRSTRHGYNPNVSWRGTRRARSIMGLRRSTVSREERSAASSAAAGYMRTRPDAAVGSSRAGYSSARTNRLNQVVFPSAAQ